MCINYFPLLLKRILFAVLVLALSFGAALRLQVAALAAPPELPFSPYGTVTIDGAPVPAGTLVAAYCGGNVYRSTLTQMQAGSAWYTNLDIPGDDPATPAKDGCASGEQVYFYIGSGLADQTVTWVSGGGGRLDLSRSLDVGQEQR